MSLQKDTDQLNREIHIFEKGCAIAMTIGLLGLIFFPSVEGKVISGMLFTAGGAIRGAPQSIDFLHTIFPSK